LIIFEAYLAKHQNHHHHQTTHLTMSKAYSLGNTQPAPNHYAVDNNHAEWLIKHNPVMHYTGTNDFEDSFVSETVAGKGVAIQVHARQSYRPPRNPIPLITAPMRWKGFEEYYGKHITFCNLIVLSEDVHHKSHPNEILTDLINAIKITHNKGK
jgi:hypothetical protein